MIMLSKRNQESRACQMRTKNVIQSLVGTKKMVVKDFFLEAETNAFVIAARPTKTEQCRCSRCHCKAKYYDGGRGARRWRTLDIGSSKAFVEASAPRVCCKKHGVVVADVPLARLNSRFCKAFEEQVTWLVTHTSRSVVSELMRIEWHTVGDVCTRVYKDLESGTTSRFDGLVNIGIDETSYKKGHKYLTVVLNHDTNSVVWCSAGFGKEVLSRFFEILTPELSLLGILCNFPIKIQQTTKICFCISSF
ncbi:helix-turn-helix domain-containing protein [Lachnospiraceae bacterium SGI.231]